MTDDDRFDSKIRHLAREVHVPPPTPREEIWERVQAQRAAGRLQSSRWFAGRMRWIVWATGAAALLALGVALGRLSMRPAATSTAALPAPTNEVETQSAAYRLATAEHLSRVETFLTVFTTEAPAGALGTDDLEQSARQLLRRTRTLRQSPAIAGDVALETLLDDVEFVLLQIAAFARAGDGDELHFVEQGINDRSVMLRLRSALPSANERRTLGGSS